MALPKTGPLTFEMIKIELGLLGSKSLDDLIQASNLADKTAPHSMSQFYNYRHDPSLTSWRVTNMELIFSEDYDYT